MHLVSLTVIYLFIMSLLFRYYVYHITTRFSFFISLDLLRARDCISLYGINNKARHAAVTQAKAGVLNG